MFGTEFLQFSGSPTNSLAGAYPGFNSLPVTPPFIRQGTLSTLVAPRSSNRRQADLSDRPNPVPTYDFNNVVSRAAPPNDPSASIPAVTGLLYTPAFVSPTILGTIRLLQLGHGSHGEPGARPRNSISPTDSTTATWRGEQTGLRGPQFNGYYFHIGEAGYAYQVSNQKKPGSFGIGG